jgi:hypothetical protein
MKGEKKINYFAAIICAIIAIIIFCAIAVIFNVMPLNSLPVSFLGATLGALIGALITLVLLRGQTDIEEKKGKDIRIHERKTEVFQKFIEAVWKVWSDKKITIEEFRDLTSQYYQYLMIYIKPDDKKGKKADDKEDRLKIIGKCLSKMGECIDKPEKVDELRDRIIDIINVLSKELELGGKIDNEIIKEHEKILFPLDFRKELLDNLNKELGSIDPAFEEGKYESIREDKTEQVWITFGLKEYPGIKLAIKFGGNLKAVFMADLKFRNIDRQEHTKGIFRRRVVNDKDLVEPLPDDEYNKTIPPFDFSKEESMKEFKEKGFENILARRTRLFVSQWEMNGLNILQYLERTKDNN